MATDGLIPIGEAARLLGVSVETLRRYGKIGILTEYRDGRKFRYFGREQVIELCRVRTPRMVMIKEVQHAHE